MATMLEKQARRWTYEEYYKLSGDQRYEILSLKAGAYELHCCAEEKGKLTSLVLPGLEFDLAEMQ